MELLGDLLSYALRFVNYVTGNFFLLILLVGEPIYVFFEARRNYVHYPTILGSVAVTAFLLHGVWAAGGIAYIDFLRELAMFLMLPCFVAYASGRVVWWIKGASPN